MPLRKPAAILPSWPGQLERARQRTHHTRKFGAALVEALRAEGLSAVFDGRSDVLALCGVNLQIWLLWQTHGDSLAHQWHLRHVTPSDSARYVLLIRMRHPYCAIDYFIVTPHELATRFPHWLPAEVASELRMFWLPTAAALVTRLRQFTLREPPG
jgi:hypothetical protein